MNLALINNAKPLFQRTLLIRINHPLATKATLTRIGPTVGGFSTPVTFGTLKFSLKSLTSLVWSRPWLLWTSQNTVLDLMTLIKTHITQIGTRRLQQAPAANLGET